MQLMPRHVITEFLIISMARTVSLSLTTSAAAAAGTLALAYESGALHLRRGSCGGLCWQRRGCKGDTLAQPQPRAHPRGGFGTHTARDGSAGGVHWCQRRRVAADRYLRRVGIQLLPRHTSCSPRTRSRTRLGWNGPLHAQTVRHDLMSCAWARTANTAINQRVLTAPSASRGAGPRKPG